MCKDWFLSRSTFQIQPEHMVHRFITTTNGSSVTFDRTAPSVTSINRLVPLTAITNGVTVVYRVTFNEKVSGATTNSFAFMLVSGTVTGTVSNVAAVGTAGTTYDVTIASISGNGDIRLDLKASGTGITDATGNAIASGFTGGQVYTISQAAPKLTSVGISSSNANSSLAKTGNIITLSFIASEPINSPQVTIATHAVTALRCPAIIIRHPIP
jgi:hypothetical protein